jgi:hypothetical protein
MWMACSQRMAIFISRSHVPPHSTRVAALCIGVELESDWRLQNLVVPPSDDVIVLGFGGRIFSDDR